MTWLRTLLDWLHRRIGISLLIFVAAVMIQGIAALQYYNTRSMIEKEAEQLALSHLLVKAIAIKGTFNMYENTLLHHVWDIKRNADDRDSIYDALEWVLRSGKDLQGCAVAYRPYYFDDTRLFEPYVYRDGDTIRRIQLSSATHDYTRMEFFRKAFDGDSTAWADPYHDDLLDCDITTYSLPLHDDEHQVYGVFGLDMSLRWLGDTLNARHYLPSSFNMLLTEGGALVSGPAKDHPRHHDIEQAVKLINDSTMEHRLGSRGRTRVVTFESAVDGRDGYIYYAHMRGNPHWQIALVCYDDEVYGDLYRQMWGMMLLMLVGFVLMGYILYRFMRSNKRLHEAELSQERTDSELRVAHSIQSEMLPVALATRAEVDVAGTLEPAKAVGGDLFDYLVRDEKLYFCIGDVSGKGVPSALVMAVTHSLFRSIASRESNPARIVQAVNDVSCQHNRSGMFVTFFVGVLDLPTGRLHYCNAGHDTPLIIHNDIEPLSVKSNLPLGVMDDWQYEGEQTTLQPGTTLLLYTDGVTEAKNVDHRQYGMERLKRVLAADAVASPQAMLKAVIAGVRRFAGAAEQSDDITMLAVRYNGRPREEYRLERELTLSNDIGEVERLGEFIKGVCTDAGIEQSVYRQMRLAIEEVVVNVINYAYPAGEQGTIEVKAAVSESKIRWTVIDSGGAFAPTDAPDADTSLSVEERAIGGLGIHLVRQLMDTINYERIDHRNVLTMVKIIK